MCAKRVRLSSAPRKRAAHVVDVDAIDLRGFAVVNENVNHVGALVRCQLRTAEHKEDVRLDAARGLVFKGPYYSTETLQRHLDFAHYLVHVMKDASVPVPQVAVDREAGKTWLVFPHLAPELIARTLVPDTKSSAIDGAVLVLPREQQGVSQARYVGSMDELDMLSEKIMFSLFARWVLGVGDTHLGNMLVAMPALEPQTGRLHYTRLMAIDAAEKRGTVPELGAPLAEVLFSKAVSEAVRVAVSRWCATHRNSLCASFSAVVPSELPLEAANRLRSLCTWLGTH